MKIYVFKYDTNYGMQVIVVITDLGLDYAALDKGLWDSYSVEILESTVESVHLFS